MSNRIEKITIVGGGTAGWLTAVMLVTVMNQRRDGPPVDVTVIESPNIPTVGVGEATIPGMPRLLNQLGISETDFFRRCNASFKLGVRFENWSVDAAGKPIDFVHPFNAPFDIRGRHNPAFHYHKFGSAAGASDIVDALVPNVAMIEHARAPRQIGTADYDAAVGYAYHLDAGLFAKFLREESVSRGIRHVVDNVVDVTLDERGFVAALQLEEGGNWPIEFVIDCSGFKGLIIDKAMKEPFEKWDKYLLCDRALAMQADHPNPSRLANFTRATALGAGWVWNVPLYSRAGLGYVFSSAFRSDDAARDEFVAFAQSQGYRVEDEPRAIGMRIGRARRGWVKNCLAVGLSAGFVEPLEATAIYSIEMTIRNFVQYFPDRAISTPLQDRFNRIVGELMENVLEFIIMHYYVSNRTDSPFWEAARRDIELPDSLVENLKLWRHALPAPLDVSDKYLFSHWSYLFCLHAKNWFSGLEFPHDGSIAEEDWRDYEAGLGEHKSALIARLPSHLDLVRAIRGETAAAGAAGAVRHGYGFAPQARR